MNSPDASELVNLPPWEQSDPFGQLAELRAARVEQGLAVFDLSMINPDLAPARFLVDKLLEATVRAGAHRYAVSRGVQRLRAAFSHWYTARHGVAIDPDTQVCVTMGCKDAVQQALAVCARLPLTKGQAPTVLLADPTYPAHRSAVHLAGMKPIFFDAFQPADQMVKDICERLLQSNPPAVLLLNLPNNPLGSCLPAELLAELLLAAAKSDIVVVNDFVYGDLVHDNNLQASVLAVAQDLTRRKLLPDSALILEGVSISKSYSVPGWRVGALCGSAAIIDRVARRKGHIDYGNFLPIQLAAAAALSASEDLSSDARITYAQRAKVVLETLREIGWEAPAVQAGSSVWIALPDKLKGAGARSFVTRLLSEHGVVVSPGDLFGARWQQYIRLALVLPDEILRNAVSAFSLIEAADN